MFPKIRAFLEPMDRDAPAFSHVMAFALDMYPMEFDDPAAHDDPQEFADMFTGGALETAYEEIGKECVEDMFKAFLKLCRDSGVQASYVPFTSM